MLIRLRRGVELEDVHIWDDLARRDPAVIDGSAHEGLGHGGNAAASMEDGPLPPSPTSPMTPISPNSPKSSIGSIEPTYIYPLPSTYPSMSDGPHFTVLPPPSISSTVPSSSSLTVVLTPSSTFTSLPTSSSPRTAPLATGSGGLGNGGKASSSSAPDNVGGTKASSRSFPHGAIAGIVISALLLAIAVGIYVVRRRAVHQRRRVRGTWLPRPFLATLKGSDVSSGDASAMEKAEGEGGSRASIWGKKLIPRVPPPPLVTPPALAHTSELPYSHDRLSAGDLASLPPPNPPFAQEARRSLPPHCGMVVYMFEPTLPDELRISIGETMRVLAEYDDGWGLCENAKGERGMIPLECLDRGDMHGYDVPQTGRLSNAGSMHGSIQIKRDSSLVAARV